MTREQAQALADKLMLDSMLRQGSSADTILTAFEACSREGFAAGLEAAAEMVEAFDLSLGRIFIERDKCAAALRERAMEERAK